MRKNDNKQNEQRGLKKGASSKVNGIKNKMIQNETEGRELWREYPREINRDDSNALECRMEKNDVNTGLKNVKKKKT